MTNPEFAMHPQSEGEQLSPNWTDHVSAEQQMFTALLKLAKEYSQAERDAEVRDGLPTGRLPHSRRSPRGFGRRCTTLRRKRPFACIPQAMRRFDF